MPCESTRWMLTWNNPPDDWQEKIKPLPLKWFVGQLERGNESGVLHLQSCFVTARQHRPGGTLRMLQGASINGHLEVMRGTVQQAIQYCTKPETAVSEAFQLGDVPKEAKKSGGQQWRERLEECRDAALAGELDDGEYVDVAARCQAWYRRVEFQGFKRRARLLKKEGAFPHVVWFCGPPGSGKSWAARTLAETQGAYFLLDASRNSVWADGYEGEATLWIDDVRPSWMDADTLKAVLDKTREARLPTKGGHCYSLARLVIVTSVDPPMDTYAQGGAAEEVTRRVDKVVRLRDRFGAPGWQPPELPTLPWAN